MPSLSMPDILSKQRTNQNQLMLTFPSDLSQAITTLLATRSFALPFGLFACTLQIRPPCDFRDGRGLIIECGFCCQCVAVGLCVQVCMVGWCTQHERLIQRHAVVVGMCIYAVCSVRYVCCRGVVSSFVMIRACLHFSHAFMRFLILLCPW